MTAFWHGFRLILTSKGGIASGATRLPNDCGLVFKALGIDSAGVKAEIRQFWKIAREEILGVTLPEQFCGADFAVLMRHFKGRKGGNKSVY